MPFKITGLNSISSIAPSDLIQIIDVDDTLTMGSLTGTNKKITASDAANSFASMISAVPPIVVNALLNKANLNSPNFSGVVSLPEDTTIGNVSKDELACLDGVTSRIQLQLDDKVSSTTPVFTGDITANIIGNSSTTTKLAVAKKIQLGGNVTGSADFDGSSDITITTAVANAAITPAKLSTGAPSWNTAGTLTSTAFNGALTGNVTGNLTGTASGNIKQGGGAQQNNTNVYMGWSNDSKLRVQVDTTDYASTWPIDISGNAATATTASSATSVDNASITAAKLSGAQIGTAPVYGIRAWAKLNPYINTTREAAYKNGTYSAAIGNTVTVTITDHGLRANDRVRLVFTRTSGSGIVPSSTTYFDVIQRVSKDVFIVSFTSSAPSSGTVIAQFITIQGAGNISSASFYDTSDDRYILNFTIPMPHVNYATTVTGPSHNVTVWARTVEDTQATTQLNTIYQAHVASPDSPKFLNVIVVG